MNENKYDRFAGRIETIKWESTGERIDYITFYGFSIDKFLLEMMITIICSMIIVIFGVIIHTWWSMVFSVGSVVRILSTVYDFGRYTTDIRNLLTKVDSTAATNIYTYLKENGTMTLRVGDISRDKRTNRTGDQES